MAVRRKIHLTACVTAARHGERLRAGVYRVVAGRVLNPAEVAFHTDTPGSIFGDCKEELIMGDKHAVVGV